MKSAAFSLLTHMKCRNNLYSSGVSRLYVPDALVPWSVQWDQYNPPSYTSDIVLKKPVWADPDINCPNFSPKFNELDGNVDRVSYTGKYNVVDGTPLNPVGRTGLKGRGLLGRWGPNHAADPIVTRWNGSDLEFVAIQRRDTGEWAIPGGMVDPGETLSATLKREFAEEALNGDLTDLPLFKNGVEIYRGYVDDPRNTDNAWMETAAYNFHDFNNSLSSLPFAAGDDAANVKWVPIKPGLQLYASHEELIKLVAKLHTHENI